MIGKQAMIVGVDKNSRAVTCCSQEPRFAKEIAKWMRQGLTLQTCSLEHAQKVLGKEWKDPR